MNMHTANVLGLMRAARDLFVIFSLDNGVHSLELTVGPESSILLLDLRKEMRGWIVAFVSIRRSRLHGFLTVSFFKQNLVVFFKLWAQRIVHLHSVLVGLRGIRNELVQMSLRKHHLALVFMVLVQVY